MSLHCEIFFNFSCKDNCQKPSCKDNFWPVSMQSLQEGIPVLLLIRWPRGPRRPLRPPPFTLGWPLVSPMIRGSRRAADWLRLREGGREGRKPGSQVWWSLLILRRWDEGTAGMGSREGVGGNRQPSYSLFMSPIDGSAKANLFFAASLLWHRHLLVLRLVQSYYKVIYRL